jgi:hypothetical protein
MFILYSSDQLPPSTTFLLPSSKTGTGKVCDKDCLMYDKTNEWINKWTSIKLTSVSLTETLAF